MGRTRDEFAAMDEPLHRGRTRGSGRDHLRTLGRAVSLSDSRADDVLRTVELENAGSDGSRGTRSGETVDQVLIINHGRLVVESCFSRACSPTRTISPPRRTGSACSPRAGSH